MNEVKNSPGCLFAVVALALVGLTACSAGGALQSIPNPLTGLFGGGGPDTTPEQYDPLIQAAVSMTRWGVLLIVGGLIFGALTKFRTGWGVTLAGTGLAMILLAWTFSHPWTPYAAFFVLAGYAIYKIYNFLNPNIPTEPFLE